MSSLQCSEDNSICPRFQGGVNRQQEIVSIDVEVVMLIDVEVVLSIVSEVILSIDAEVGSPVLSSPDP